MGNLQLEEWGLIPDWVEFARRFGLAPKLQLRELTFGFENQRHQSKVESLVGNPCKDEEHSQNSQWLSVAGVHWRISQ